MRNMNRAFNPQQVDYVEMKVKEAERQVAEDTTQRQDM